MLDYIAVEPQPLQIGEELEAANPLYLVETEEEPLNTRQRFKAPNVLN